MSFIRIFAVFIFGYLAIKWLRLQHQTQNTPSGKKASADLEATSCPKCGAFVTTEACDCDQPQ